VHPGQSDSLKFLLTSLVFSFWVSCILAASAEYNRVSGFQNTRRVFQGIFSRKDMADSTYKMLTQKCHKMSVFHDTIRSLVFWIHRKRSHVSVSAKIQETLSIVPYGSAASMGGSAPSAHLNYRGLLPITETMLLKIQKRSIKKIGEKVPISLTTPACQGFLDIEQEFPLQHNFRLLASVYAWLGAQTLPKHVQPGLHLRMHLLTETEYLC